MEKDRKYLGLAKEASKQADYYHRLGAVIVKKNRVLSVGYNKPHKTHPESKTRFKTVHAEFDAIKKLSEADLRGATIYVMRDAKSGERMARPCQCCMDLIKLVGIKKIIYSSNEGYETIHV